MIPTKNLSIVSVQEHRAVQVAQGRTPAHAWNLVPPFAALIAACTRPTSSLSLSETSGTSEHDAAAMHLLFLGLPGLIVAAWEATILLQRFVLSNIVFSSELLGALDTPASGCGSRFVQTILQILTSVAVKLLSRLHLQS